MVKIKFYKL